MKPPFCPYVYHDRDELFLEFDTLVLRFPFTEAGLSKALHHIPSITQHPGYTNGRSIAALGLEKMKGHVAKRAKAQIAKLATPAQDAKQVAAVEEFLKDLLIPTKAKPK